MSEEGALPSSEGMVMMSASRPPKALIERANRFPRRLSKRNAAESGAEAARLVIDLVRWAAPLLGAVDRRKLEAAVTREVRAQHTFQLILWALMAAEGILGRGLTVREIEVAIGGWVGRRRIQALLAGPLYIYTTEVPVPRESGGYRIEYRICPDPSKNKDLTPKQRAFVGAMVSAVAGADWKEALGGELAIQLEEAVSGEEFLAAHRKFALAFARVHLNLRGHLSAEEFDEEAYKGLESTMKEVRRFFAFADATVLAAIATAQRGNGLEFAGKGHLTR